MRCHSGACGFFVSAVPTACILSGPAFFVSAVPAFFVSAVPVLRAAVSACFVSAARAPALRVSAQRCPLPAFFVSAVPVLRAAAAVLDQTSSPSCDSLEKNNGHC